MKKLKQFYKNNEKTILVCSGVVVGSITTAYFGQLAVSSVQLADANLYEVAESGAQFLRVELTNGAVRDFAWKATEVVA